ncbi:3-deoxy-manno-octulosonate cytidylyltransferase [Oceanimonas baumannii]|uniref:3-deoxy-manno-octulosonate cytidylyltransferase n=1 Tax=Oceanimonas baumannii TaxID=129578 RepID=A0A235CM80_9GAMM|nr:3-deoxy-manno-octulosonate cytidylyltransferase [Oceanimonas baumannii]OYD25127.1 3-deoxy-manno-octulosonate cytidylyltransferase [Oceanimonas baumannii]TDW62589.1 3-deoxy-manno-octulosonate cytidylyltransferase (CMP-KDO synthetase) [Oceanimonas baumannii]
MSFIVVIPARMQSTRLPGKPLADIHGKSMIERVAEQALKSGAERVVVATDDHRIGDALAHCPVEICLTGSHHESGTERLAEVVTRLQLAPDDIVVNVQGDEPLLPPALINEVAALLATGDAPMATLATPLLRADELTDPNVVKVVHSLQGRALYFSRAPIPFDRDDNNTALDHCLRHIGIYAYRAGFISRYVALPAGPLEQLEKLEQLRVLWHGEPIALGVASEVPPAGVDTPADLEAVRRHLAAG